MKNIFTISSQHVGQGPALFQWQKRSSDYLAVVGALNIVNLVDRHGHFVDTVALGAACTAMEWSPDGELLAITQSRSGQVLLWDTNTRRASNPIETNAKHVRFLRWSSKGEYLAIGTGKGNLLIYDRREHREYPIVGKHTKSIVTGCWSWDDILACGSEDKTFSLSNAAGDTIFSMGLTGEPSDMQWANMKNAQGVAEPVLSTIIGQKSLFIHKVNHPESPIELAFQPAYGDIVAYEWFGEGLILVAFATGQLIVISTNTDELGHEKFSTRNQKGVLSHISISRVLGKAATCGDNTVRVHELSDMKDVYAVETIEDEGVLDKLQWSADGQFLTASTTEGSVYTFLARMPQLGSVYGTLVAHLTNLHEITLHDQGPVPKFHTQPKVKKELEIEPTAIAVGDHYLGVVSGTRAGFYNMKAALATSAREGETTLCRGDQAPVMIKEYSDTVKTFRMNPHYALALLNNGHLHVHAILEPAPSVTEQVDWRIAYRSFGRECPRPSLNDHEHTFPETNHDESHHDHGMIQSAALTPEFVIFGTSQGKLSYHMLEGWSLVAETQHKEGIKAIFPQPKAGTKTLFIDALNDGYLTDPTSNSLLSIPRWSAKTEGVLWESDPPPNRSIFVSWDDAYVTTYVYQPFTIKGPSCIALGVTKLPFGQRPILLLNGVLTCQAVSGRLSLLPLSTHETPSKEQYLRERPSEQDQGKSLQVYYTLGLYKETWQLIDVVKSRKPWIMLAETALRALDVVTAKRIYRQVLSDAGMVVTLERLDNVEERMLLAGHVSGIFGDVSAAQEFYLKSTYPKAALDLRRSLMQWDQAMSLANTLSPEDVTVIAKEYAHQLESNSRYTEALAMYERALSTSEQHPGQAAARDEHQIACSGGVARMTMRLGDISRGMKMIAGTEDRQLLYDCGCILDTLKQFNDAASCFERGEFWEKAAELWIKARSWSKVGAVLDKVTSPKLFAQYARAKESEKDYIEAARAYDKARDYDNVVRLFIDHLNNIDGAVAIVRQTRSRESARLISKFFQSIKDYRSVVEFYLMAGMQDEAFELAQQRDVMEHYAELVREDTTPSTLYNIASYLENKGNFLTAGKYLLQAGDYAKALAMFLQCPAHVEGGVDLAIETVGLAKSDALTHQLIDYLMGETDGIPKDAKYIFKLYMSLGQYKEAARTAIIIAREEQALGNYRAARDLLLDNYRQLRATKNHVPAEIERMLMLLHSYILVKTLVRINEHSKGARMLMRIANNISKFPAHIVPILTSTVIECYRAGFMRAAFEYAAMLMRPEYRNKVDAKYKRKIEQIVRRPEKDELDEPTSPCPFCGTGVPESVLDCLDCKNHLPYCIATGRHMVLSDWTTCPSCTFPSLYSEFTDLLSKSPGCPMCSADVSPDHLVRVPEEEARSALMGRKAQKDEAEALGSSQSTTKEVHGMHVPIVE
ncbi:hypothetical protein DFS34DRAFT_717341 [Phlyctochytrium arcticum]|nr:hypothetical protein DFS34DRAFT_717341 [Phlyctochytrium arcticum]